MKITRIKIKDFHQFKDFDIDLTYPKGHAKEGKPLDKVCFIGQSGTGKTSLLEIIPKFTHNVNTQFIVKNGKEAMLENIIFSVEFGIFNEYKSNLKFNRIIKSNGDNIFRRIWPQGTLYSKEKLLEFEEIFTYFKNEWQNKLSSKLIYFPANLNYDIEIGIDNILTDKSIIDFSEEKVSAVWNLILEKIQKYQEQELQIRQEISKTVEQASNNLKKIEQAVNKLKEWKSTEFNPIEDIANNCLNKLLEPFKLRIKTELDIKSKDDIGFIKVVDYAGNEIPHGLWSTGTKQVILSAMPLYLLKPKYTVILFDEPERSLYPDIQRRIIDYYSSLTDNCQFFYATHSPIIASSFEPWEIVELKFNKEGHVYRELYFEGENHVDNYKWNPKYMRWDDILIRVFDMENDGSLDRRKKLDELATQNIKYNKLKKQGKEDSDDAKNILLSIDRLRKELSKWD